MDVDTILSENMLLMYSRTDEVTGGRATITLTAREAVDYMCLSAIGKGRNYGCNTEALDDFMKTFDAKPAAVYLGQFTMDGKGAAVWPDSVKLEHNGEWYDKECLIRGSDMLGPAVHDLFGEILCGEARDRPIKFRLEVLEEAENLVPPERREPG